MVSLLFSIGHEPELTPTFKDLVTATELVFFSESLSPINFSAMVGWVVGKWAKKSLGVREFGSRLNFMINCLERLGVYFSHKKCWAIKSMNYDYKVQDPNWVKG